MAYIEDNIVIQGEALWGGIVVLSRDIAWLRILTCVIDHCKTESVRESRIVADDVLINTYERIIRVMVHEEP